MYLSKNHCRSRRAIPSLCPTSCRRPLCLAQFPGYKKSPFFDKLSGTLKTFYPILSTTQHQRPVTPAEDYYVGQLLNEVSNALYGKKTPKKALDDVTKNVQSYLDGILKKAKS